MTEVILSEKTCTKCGETKPLSDYYKKANTKDGKSYRCKDCVKSAVAEYQERKKEEIGIDAWREQSRAAAKRSRTKNGYRTEKLYGQAARSAVERLKAAHPQEYAAYLREEKYARGLSVDD